MQQETGRQAFAAEIGPAKMAETKYTTNYISLRQLWAGSYEQTRNWHTG